MKKISYLLILILAGCQAEDRIYTDINKVPDGKYIVTFDNQYQALMLVKNKELYSYNLMVDQQKPNLIGHKPIRFDPAI